jgi:hypothetical protein
MLTSTLLNKVNRMAVLKWNKIQLAETSFAGQSGSLAIRFEIGMPDP